MFVLKRKIHNMLNAFRPFAGVVCFLMGSFAHAQDESVLEFDSNQAGVDSMLRFVLNV